VSDELVLTSCQESNSGDLDLSGLGITKVEIGTFATMTTVVDGTLDLSGNRLSSIPTNAFEGLGQLQALKLTGNKIVELEAGAFEALVSLTFLDLGSNLLAKLDSEMLRGLAFLRELVSQPALVMMSLKMPHLPVLPL
jgi:hypothetical protein